MEGVLIGAVVDTIVGSSVKNLISLLTKENEFSRIKGAEKDVTKLLNTLSIVQAVLEDAEEKQLRSKPVADWLRRLRDATYDAEDILDAWSLRIQQQRQVQSASASSTSPVCLSLSPRLHVKNIMFHRKIAKRVKEICSTFDEIALQKSQFHLNTDVVLQIESPYNKDRESTSAINEPHIYGTDENKMKIVDMLINIVVNNANVSVCPIVGMAGLGKTTLAQSIYNDESVQRHFDLKTWVCVSEPFDIKRVLKSIIESFEKKACGLVSLETINNKVEGILMEKRYLIVLDDVWNENQEEWKKLKSFFKGGKKGSSVVLTTRSLTVAYITATAPPYFLGVLSDDDCFSLLKNEAIGDRPEDGLLNLITIGKEIAKKCKGVPLVAKSLGSLLRFKTDEREWELVRDSEIWALNETRENRILAALRLSYYHLPSHLKQCFTYCSVFHKDIPISRRKLIYSWIANGFVQSREKMELEDVGDDIFKELLHMSFFQDAIEDTYGNVETCKMHGLMHDLASSVMTNECLILKVGETKHVPKTIRHLRVVCVSSCSPIYIDYLLLSKPSLRTLSFSHTIDFHKFQFSSTLRVLDLSWRSIVTLPPSVCDLKHLRYLDLSGNLLKSLPESIRRLRNLQMLDLSHNQMFTALPLSICELEYLRYLDLFNCKGITSLPESISGLRNLQSLILRDCALLEPLPGKMRTVSSLKHLDISGCGGLGKMPVGIEQSSSLQTLSDFVVGRLSDGDSAGGGISDLQGLNQLRGRLMIRGLEMVRDREDARKANLTSKRYLTKLVLHWAADHSLRLKNSKEVLEGLLQLPLHIKDLEIRNYQWEARFPAVFVQSLKALKSLTISECHKLFSLPSGLLQKLTSLEILKIWHGKSLKSLGIQWNLNPITSSSSFSSSSSRLQSSLKKLEIYDCPVLILLEEDFHHLNALTHLRLKDLHQLTALPQGILHLPMLRHLYIVECSNMRMLPKWAKHLTGLYSLEIKWCHKELHKRCEKEKGEDWHLISHIPRIELLSKTIGQPPETVNKIKQYQRGFSGFLEIYE